MAQFHDARAVQWSVHRRWWNVDVVPNLSELGGDLISLVAGFICLVIWAPFALIWPFWLLAKFCGVPWKVRIRRNREVVYTERVSGWSNSQRRIDEIVQSLLRGAGEPTPAGWSAAAPASSTAPVMTAGTTPGASDCLCTMHSWLDRAEQATGYERDVALTSAGEWSSRYEERRRAEGQTGIGPEPPAHWIYRAARGLVLFIVFMPIMGLLLPYLVQLGEHILGLLSRRQ